MKGVFERLSRRAVSQSNYNRNHVYALKIPVPPKNEQVKIVEIIGSTDAKLVQERDRKSALESLFNSTLESLMSAKIRVN